MKTLIKSIVISIVACTAILITLKTTVAPNNKTHSPYTYGKASHKGTGKFYLGREIANVISPSGAACML